MDKVPSAADLAALKVRLEDMSNRVGLRSQDTADLRLAARCVAAWAKLEDKGVGGWKMDWDEWGDPALMTGYHSGGYPTALAAVEGAEGKS
jgi:hypothetical protein